MSGLKQFIQGDAAELKLRGPPPAQAQANLRTLDNMGLLEADVVWGMLSQCMVDPLFLIRILRQHKGEVGLHEEEHFLGDSVVFLAGEKVRGGAGHKVAYHVNLFTNDVSVMVHDGTGYIQTAASAAGEIYAELQGIPVGEERLSKLLSMVKAQVDTALAPVQISQTHPTPT
jgi:hypothetical protein